MLVIALWTQEIILERVASRVIRDVQDKAEFAIADINNTFWRTGQIAESWLSQRWSGEWSEPDFERLFVPLLRTAPVIASAIVASPEGDLYVLTRRQNAWRSTLLRPSEWGRQARIRRWSNDRPAIREGWAELDHSVYESPWLTFALGLYDALGPGAPLEARAYVGDPREFIATGDTGRIASVALTRADGQVAVLGLQVRTKEITEVMRGIRRPERGRDALLYGSPNSKQSLLFLGVPDDPRVPTLEQASRYLLRPPAELGGPISDLLDRLFELEEYTLGEPVRFTSGGEPWWGMAREVPTIAGFVETTAPPRWFVMANTEASLLAHVPNVFPWIVAATVLIVGLAVWRALRLAGSIGRPIEQLVDESRRMQRLSFEQEARVDTDIVELNILGRAIDSMRGALRSYAEGSEEERIAEAITRAALPPGFPRPPGYQIEAFRRPAEEADGAVFDVIARSESGRAKGRRKRVGSRESVACLMLDPRASGIEAAVLSAQLRAVFLAGARAGVDLEQIAVNVAAFLQEDLRDAAAVRAWFGELDAGDATLACHAAGFDTVLHYRAAERDCVPAGEVGPALGGAEKAKSPTLAKVKLAPGDIVAVASMGVVDALDAARQRFGSARIEALLAEHAGISAAEIAAQMEAALDAFCEGAHVMSDQTMLLIKRQA